MTQPLFCLSTGRSGTYLIHKILSLYPNVESHHEYCIEHTQKLSVLRRAGVVSEDMAALQLRETHLSGVHYSQADYFCDSSNKLSFLIKPLRVILPDSRFIHLVRDGRRVVSSYYHKLVDEAMVDKWVSRVRYHVRQPYYFPAPPPLKPNWWPSPDLSADYIVPYSEKWNRWQRLCWYWQDCNRAIMKGLEEVPDSQKYTVRLEDLASHIRDLADLLDWLRLLDNEQILDEARNLCQTPQNVSEPVSYPLTSEQEEQYWEICGEMHEQLGYGKDDYEVKYR